MGRSEHFLYRPRPSAWPKAVICLAVDVEWLQSPTHTDRQTLQLVSWHVIVIGKGRGGYNQNRLASGTTQQAFWDGLGECLSRLPNATIICHNTREAAAALGLWEKLEDGSVLPKGRDYRSTGNPAGTVSDLSQRSNGMERRPGQSLDCDTVRELPAGNDANKRVRTPKVGRGSKAARGVMILLDPPVVMELSLLYCGQACKWLDALNYGVDLHQTSGGATAHVKALADWFLAAQSFLKSVSDCGWQNTAGSQAIHLFKRTFLDEPILSHTHPKASALERSALFGGRCECFRVGKIPGRSHLLDVRSMYPHICSVLPVPIRLCGVLEGTDAAKIVRHSISHFVIAECEVTTDEPRYAYRVGRATIYPVGRFTTCLAGSELGNAISVGNVRKVRRAALYEAGITLGRYAQTLYAARQDCDLFGSATESAFIKRLMVSVVGKFAQTERGWRDCPKAESPSEWSEWYTHERDGEVARWRSIAGHVQREVVAGWSHGAVPAITVAITSSGRYKINRIMDAAGRENVWYCDTDAVIVSDYGRECLQLAGYIEAGRWGMLQPVVSSDHCIIYGDKYYEIGDRKRTAGLSRRGQGGGVPSGATASHPWIGWSLRHQERPADWRGIGSAPRRVGRYDRIREAGGAVKPIEVWEEL